MGDLRREGVRIAHKVHVRTGNDIDPEVLRTSRKPVRVDVSRSRPRANFQDHRVGELCDSARELTKQLKVRVRFYDRCDRERQRLRTQVEDQRVAPSLIGVADRYVPRETTGDSVASIRFCGFGPRIAVTDREHGPTGEADRDFLDRARWAERPAIYE